MENDVKKSSVLTIGFWSAAGVLLYVVLVSLAIWRLDKFVQNAPGAGGIAFMLMLLVFSAAVTGSLVFGYPAFLALNKKTKQAILTLIATLSFVFLFALLGVIALLVLAR